MPSVSNFVETKFGCQLSAGRSASNATGLATAATNTPEHLNSYLYDAVVGLFQGVKLDKRLSKSDLKLLFDLSEQSRQVTSNPSTKTALNEFRFMCQRYLQLLNESTGNGETQIMNKQVANSAFPNAVPKHTLVATGDQLFEHYTWLNPTEHDRLKERYAFANGLQAVRVEKQKTQTRHGMSERLTKCRVGAGSFAVARLGRSVNDDQYIVVKKSHPKHAKDLPTEFLRLLQPKQLAIVPQLNDGSLPGVAKVYASHTAKSTSAAGISNGSSSYAYLELGVSDVQNFIDDFSLLRFATEGGFSSQGLGYDILQNICCSLLRNAGTGVSDSEKNALLLLQINRMNQSPFQNPDTVRRFLNRLAFQMLECVHQMHRRNVAHNDIKPNNFVLANHNDKLRVKLIDLDMNSSINNPVDSPRESSAEIDDAYALGCSIHQVIGDASVETALRRNLAGGETWRWIGVELEPVEDLQRIEAMQKIIPEMASLSQVADLLCQPDMNQRYTVEQAMENMVFNQTNAMMNESEFSELATAVLRDGGLISKEFKERLFPPGNQEAAILNELEISRANKRTAQDYLEKQFTDSHGEFELQERLQRVDQLCEAT